MASSSAASDFDRGRRIGKYEIITRLSVGGMAELYLAYLPGPGGFKKFVAVKQILPDVKADESFVKMFLDEARITAAFNCANIGQVFDLGEDDKSGELYLAMEFIAGQNLEQIIKRAAKKQAAIPVGFAARVVRDTCLGLHYAHSFTDPTGKPMPVVHRDVSPKNIMVTYTGQVKVIDYGIAKARGRLNRTQVGIVKGTSGYMSPEQVKNEALDGRTDLFAAAVMLHEMLCGERLFTAPTDAAMMLKIVEGETPDPTAVNPYCPRALADVVLKGLAKKREQRFSSGKELARAIEQACPDMFDDEQVAELMTQLFDDKIALTRSLLELANEGRDTASMTRAVQGLTSDPGEESGGGKKKTTDGGAQRSSATPRGGMTPKSGVSSQRLPKVGAGAKGMSARSLPPVGPGAKSSQRLPKVGNGSSRVLPPVAPDDDEVTSKKRPKEDVDATIPPRGRSQMKLPPVQAQPQPEDTAPPPAKKGGLTGLLAIVSVLVVLAGIGWAVAFGPLKDHAAELAKADDEHPLDTGPKKIDVAPSKGDDRNKPAWVLEKERQKKAEEEERAKQKAIEDAANDPERQALLQEIQAQLQQLNTLEAEQRQLKIDAKAGKAAGEANTKKIEDLQKQIDDLKNALKDKQERADKPGSKRTRDGVEVVTDKHSAKAADVGFLTLRTVNPSSAAVFLGGTSLGSTPLVKVPIDVGVHKLRVVDGDSKNRVLSVTIEPGKTAEMKAIDVSSLPMQ